MDVTRRVMTNVPPGKIPGMGAMGVFHHMRAFPDANFKAVVRPNFDTLYSSAWLDLTKEPVIMTVPDTAGRYYLLPIYDMWTDAFAVPGSRTSGNEAGIFAIVPQGWAGRAAGRSCEDRSTHSLSLDHRPHADQWPCRL